MTISVLNLGSKVGFRGNILKSTQREGHFMFLKSPNFSITPEKIFKSFRSHQKETRNVSVCVELQTHTGEHR